MNDAPACPKACGRVQPSAEATSDPEMKVYLLKLGLSWMQAATTATRDEPLLERGPPTVEDASRLGHRRVLALACHPLGLAG